MKLKIFSAHSSVDLSNNESEVLSKKAVAIQVLVLMMANLTVLGPGMGLGYPAVTSEILLKDKKLVLTAEQVSWFASITPFMCPFGGPLSSYLVTKFGRKGTLLVINVISIIFWTIIGFSHKTDANTLFIELMTARVLTGLAIGMTTAPAVMYSIEICHPKLRGRFAVLSAPLFISMGTLLIFFFGYITGVRKHFSSHKVH